MQTARTLRGTRSISLLALLVPLIGYAHSSPLQYLPNVPGYVPVYIRYGDEPLERINPNLAEAFGETSNSIKTLQNLETLRDSDSFKTFKDDDIDAFLGEPKRKHAYPLRVRETQARRFPVIDDNESGNRNPNKPKLLNIYELPDDEGRPRRRYRERARMRNLNPAAFKVSPFSDAPKEELEKLATEVEKEETKPNDFYMPSFKDSEPSFAGISGRRNAPNVDVTKAQSPPDDSLINLPETPQAGDVSKYEDEDNVNIPENDKTDKKEPAIKEQEPATVLSNADKESPVDLPDDNKTGESIMFITQKPPVADTTSPEIPHVADLSEESHNRDVAAPEIKEKDMPVKVQLAERILSNGDKPIDQPGDNDNEDSKIKDSTEPNDEMATD